jgi:signal transduction histidine kinase
MGIGGLERRSSGRVPDEVGELVESVRRSFVPRQSVKRAADETPHNGGPEQLRLGGPLQAMIDDLGEQIALVDENWTILAVNRAWTKSLDAEDLRLPLRVGDNYYAFCKSIADRGNKEGMIVLEGLKQIDSGNRTSLQHVYSQPGAKKSPEFRLVVSSFMSGGRRFGTVARYEVTELMTLTRRYRRLEQSMVHVQEEERRRIGRELHDSTAQLLVALQLSMIRLKAMHQDPASVALFGEVNDTLNLINQEIRAISYLLHPPALEEGGLVESLDAMARGFGRRTNLRIGFWFEGEPGSWEPMIEFTLYRLAQEALANVHHHARASQVGIRLVATRLGFLHLIVEDDGVGIPIESTSPHGPLGVGIAGMRSRIAELGGRFSIRPMPGGTCLMASVPLAPRRPRPIDLIG